MSSAEKQRVVEEEMNRLRGRLCGLIESWGLKESQQTGANSTLKYLTYESQRILSDILSEDSR